MELFIKRIRDGVKLPTKGSDGAGAYDIWMDGVTIQRKGDLLKACLGFATQIPDGYVAKLYPRSSAGVKRGVKLANTVGIIDSDYRGEWAAFFYADSDIDFDGHDRLFQFTIEKVESPIIIEVDKLPGTKRGGGGFGSTG